MRIHRIIREIVLHGLILRNAIKELHHSNLGVIVGLCLEWLLYLELHCAKVFLIVTYQCQFLIFGPVNFIDQYVGPCRYFMVLFSQMSLLYQCILHQKQSRVMWIHSLLTYCTYHRCYLLITYDTEGAIFRKKKLVVILIVYMKKKMFYSRYKTIYLWF